MKKICEINDKINIVEVLNKTGVLWSLYRVGNYIYDGIGCKVYYNKEEFQDFLFERWDMFIRKFSDDSFRTIVLSLEELEWKYLKEEERDIKTVEYVKRLNCWKEYFSCLNYCFNNKTNNKWKRFFYIYGAKNLGKTSYLNNTMNKLFFDIDMANEDWLSQSFTHEMVLIEETTKEISSTAVQQVKALTGNAKRINANVKYGANQTVENKTKLWIDSNFLVRMKYYDVEYMTDRAIIIAWNDVTKGEKIDCDRNTLYSIMMDCKMSVEELDEFCKEERQKWAIDNNTVFKWYSEENPNHPSYFAYEDWCKDNKEMPISKNNFKIEINKLDLIK